VYLAIRETINPIKPDATNYAELTSKALRPYLAFTLRDARSKEIQYGQWQQFIEYIINKK
jgi:hypothetical protein